MLVINGTDLLECQITMHRLTKHYDGVLVMEPVDAPPPPNQILRRFLMLPGYSPMGTLEPWLRLNRSSNPLMARWMIVYVDEEDGARAIVRALGNQ